MYDQQNSEWTERKNVRQKTVLSIYFREFKCYFCTIWVFKGLAKLAGVWANRIQCFSQQKRTLWLTAKLTGCCSSTSLTSSWRQTGEIVLNWVGSCMWGNTQTSDGKLLETQELNLQKTSIGPTAWFDQVTWTELWLTILWNWDLTLNRTLTN